MALSIRDIKSIINETISDYTGNCNIISKWKEPLISVASADDLYFEKLKRIISEKHKNPDELLPGAESVITYFLPFAEEIPKSNEAGRDASLIWARAYIETNRLISIINKNLKKEIEDKGYNAAGPAATDNFSKKDLISYWSHKHVAWIAGLGRFGLHKMLITEAGSAGRIGSLVVDFELPVKARPTQELCLYYKDGSCKECIRNCVFGALEENSFNRQLCYSILKENAAKYNGSADVCGKCTVGVPCAIL
ncbi:epoxyqueuosine reductase [Halanaerobiaceae bacterium Z-7014]|uniref:Epoxyqueuosine reductase n=1 Tax=Halonatronomonas betaini TaxID=2778430 RepID=A0A931AWG3_9FIRM|nr:epoxyqueuosine reductase [Halonatronomonas betaini]MBF8437949.1 epoxyqueuosine reductase [Halonatronomonas betaini]